MANQTRHSAQNPLKPGIYARAFDGKLYSPEAKVDFLVNKKEFLTLDSVSLLGVVAAVAVVIIGLGVFLVARRK